MKVSREILSQVKKTARIFRRSLSPNFPPGTVSMNLHVVGTSLLSEPLTGLSQCSNPGSATARVPCCYRTFYFDYKTTLPVL